jgi:hypothetical protein
MSSPKRLARIAGVLYLLVKGVKAPAQGSPPQAQEQQVAFWESR